MAPALQNHALIVDIFKLQIHLAPFPANLALVLLDFDICVNTLAAEQLKVAVAAISFLLLQRVHHCKVVLWAPALQFVC